MTVWSASTFNNELDVLEIRLETLDPIVDRSCSPRPPSPKATSRNPELRGEQGTIRQVAAQDHVRRR